MIMSSNKTSLCRICGKTERKLPFYDIFEHRFTSESNDEEIILYDAMQQLTGVEMVDVSTSTNKICDSCRVRIEYAFKLRTEIIDSNELLIGPKPLMITKLKSVANTEFYRIINVADDSQEGVINDNIDIEFVEAENNADVEYLLEDISDAQTDATQVANESDRDTATGEETSEEASLGKWTKFKSTNDESTRKINSKDDINELDNQEQNDESDAVSFLLGNSHLLDKMQSNEDTKNKGRPHACKVCSKSFLRKSNLVDHLRLHANLRLYQCSHCDKSFVQAGNYKSHLRIHTKERPFQCTLCPKTYNQSSALKVHIRSHTNERNYICDICNKSFTNSSDLSKHKRVHDSSQKLNCNFCDKQFAQKINWKSHMRKHHPTESCNMDSATTSTATSKKFNKTEKNVTK